MQMHNLVKSHNVWQFFYREMMMFALKMYGKPAFPVLSEQYLKSGPHLKY